MQAKEWTFFRKDPSDFTLEFRGVPLAWSRHLFVLSLVICDMVLPQWRQKIRIL